MNTFIVSLYKLSFILLDFLGGWLLVDSVMFESFESKTSKMRPVFNEVRLVKGQERDIWLMRQSHDGVHAKDWDELKIIVHKSEEKYTASYHQLNRGKEIEYKVSCFSCHSGGPRAIRPNFDSQKVKLNMRSRLSIFAWNVLIKSYGDVEVKPNDPFTRKVKLVNEAGPEVKKLKLNACTQCHYRGGPRAPLTGRNVSTMQVLIENKMMPPWPLSLDIDELNHLKRFIYGF